MPTMPQKCEKPIKSGRIHIVIFIYVNDHQNATIYVVIYHPSTHPRLKLI